MRITPLTNAIGAVIEDADPRDPDLDFAAVHAALLDHEVIVFPGANLDPDEHVGFGRRFGEPSVYPVARFHGATGPSLTTITDLPGQRNAADHWHTDVTWSPTPPKCALLQAVEVPERGGDTLWGSTTAAYAALSPRTQEWLAGLEVEHSAESLLREARARRGDDPDGGFEAWMREHYPPVAHPLVRTHPETGRRALFYGGTFHVRVLGVSAAESRAVLDLVRDQISDPAFHCRWHWRVGDLAVWDERSTVHRAAGDHFPFGRAVRRLEVDGDRPFFDPAR